MIPCDEIGALLGCTGHSAVVGSRLVNRVQEPEASPLTKLLICVDTRIPCTVVETSFFKRSGNLKAIVPGRWGGSSFNRD